MPDSEAYGFSSVRRRFDSFSICFSLSITSLGSMPWRTLATSVGMVCAVRARSVGVSLQLQQIDAPRRRGCRVASVRRIERRRRLGISTSSLWNR